MQQQETKTEEKEVEGIKLVLGFFVPLRVSRGEGCIRRMCNWQSGGKRRGMVYGGLWVGGPFRAVVAIPMGPV